MTELYNRRGENLCRAAGEYALATKYAPIDHFLGRYRCSLLNRRASLLRESDESLSLFRRPIFIDCATDVPDASGHSPRRDERS